MRRIARELWEGRTLPLRRVSPKECSEKPLEGTGADALRELLLAAVEGTEIVGADAKSAQVVVGSKARPTFITPMAAQLVSELPDGAEWLYELKLDGSPCSRTVISNSKHILESAGAH
jgi:ATP-dependent DNA ligase